MELSNHFYRDKKVIRKMNIDTIEGIMKFAESMFANLVVLIYSESSERIYFSENVKSIMGYSVNGLVNMTDFEFLTGIHPEDVKPVRLCMERVHAMYQDPDYDHINVRYRLKLRYRKGTGEYAHISYEAVTIQYQEHYADIALIMDNTRISPHDHVELIVEKKIGNKFIVIDRFIPSGNNEITRREQEIILLLDKGFSNRQIAEKLSISEFTVKNHKRNLFKKFNVRSSLQLVRRLQNKNGAE